MPSYAELVRAGVAPYVSPTKKEHMKFVKRLPSRDFIHRPTRKLSPRRFSPLRFSPRLSYAATLKKKEMQVGPSGPYKSPTRRMRTLPRTLFVPQNIGKPANYLYRQ